MTSARPVCEAMLCCKAQGKVVGSFAVSAQCRFLLVFVMDLYLIILASFNADGPGEQV